MEKPGMRIIKARTGNLFNVGMIEKGISQVMLSRNYTKAINRFTDKTERYDLILYSTPPITLTSVVAREKRRNNAVTYLMLKDIFPQNAIDIGLLPKPGIRGGLKGIICGRFRKQEKKLYSLSDKIGCMSPANVKYLLENNPEVPPEKVEICPNSIIVKDLSVDEPTRTEMRNKYGLPLDRVIFVYGGNLGKPQDIPFVTECLRASKEIKEAHFLVVGDGTEYGILKEYYDSQSAEPGSSFTLIDRLPKEDYDRLVAACDVGLIFLDYRFTIPNYPSRLLSYMQAKIPVLSVTDEASDIGTIAEANGYGWRALSSSPEEFASKVKNICGRTDLKEMGEKAFAYLNEEYNAGKGCEIIRRAVREKKHN